MTVRVKPHLPMLCIANGELSIGGSLSSTVPRLNYTGCSGADPFLFIYIYHAHSFCVTVSSLVYSTPYCFNRCKN